MNWVQRHQLIIIQFDDDRTDIFIGPSGIGKTNFALSHFSNACHITCRQDFDKLGPTKFNYDRFVVDDLPLYKWDPKELIALTDKKFLMSINVKYGTGIIRAGMPRIICSNDIDLGRRLVARLLNDGKFLLFYSLLDSFRCRIKFFDDTLFTKHWSEPLDVRSSKYEVLVKGKFV